MKRARVPRSTGRTIKRARVPVLRLRGEIRFRGEKRPLVQRYELIRTHHESPILKHPMWGQPSDAIEILANQQTWDCYRYTG